VGTPPILATTLGFSVGAVTRFLLSYFHVFSPTSGMGQVMLRFVVALLIQMAANSLLLAALLAAGLPVWKAQVVTTVTLTFFTFLAGRLWVFR
jgi:putative flippase GtrA